MNSINRQKMPEIILLVGLPGSGKSTWAERNSDRYTVLSTDWYIEIIQKQTGRPYSEVFAEMKGPSLRERMLEELKLCLSMDMDVAIDRCNINKENRGKILSLVPSHYHKVARVFSPSPVVLKARLLQREVKTGKIIPPDVVESMLRDWEDPDYTEFNEIIIEE